MKSESPPRLHSHLGSGVAGGRGHQEQPWYARGHTTSLKGTALVATYLAAVVAATLSVARWGPAALPFTAFFLIGFDLTSRDALHERWKNDRLWTRMAALIASGSLLAWLMNADAGSVALASFLAFAAGGLVNALVYHVLHNRPPLVKINTSNFFSALTDSLVFPGVAFALFDPLLSATQWAAKFGGGFLWCLLLRKLWRSPCTK